MSLDFRIKFAFAFAKYMRFRIICDRMTLSILSAVCPILCSHLRNKRDRQTAALKWRVDVWCERSRLVTRELSSQNTEHRINRDNLLREASELQSESRMLLSEARWLQYPDPVGILAFQVLAIYGASLERRGKKLANLRTVVSQIEFSKTFCLDVLIWFIVPGSYNEQLLGDMNEEFSLRCIQENELAAQAWYFEHAMLLIFGRLWRTLEQFLVIATLIDLIKRLVQK